MEYELLDSGHGEKLERFGQYILHRPDPEVLWPAVHPELWKTADAHFVRVGQRGTVHRNLADMADEWHIEMHGLKLWVHLGAFKHVGLFPEQMDNWQWMAGMLKSKNRQLKILNLFGYTGAASCVLARVGAEVTHVDGANLPLIGPRKMPNLTVFQLFDLWKTTCVNSSKGKLSAE